MKLIKKLKKETKKEKHILTKATNDGTVKCPYCYMTLDYETFEKPTCRNCGKTYDIVSMYAIVKEK